MTLFSLLPIFLIGLLGGVHCVGMCGGIIGAFAVASPRRSIPIHAAGITPHPSSIRDTAPRVLAFNVGRIGSYMVAGMLAGLLGSFPAMVNLASVQTFLCWLANLMLVALGLTLMNIWHGLSRLEQAGQVVWRQVQPLLRKLLPVQHPSQALALGALWGWVPCGMVYSVLMTALLSGSATSGALVMLAFGLGTLPLLFTMGVAGLSLQPLLQRASVRRMAGLVVLSFGVAGLVRVGMGMSNVWLDTLCITPAVH
ncbi:MAG: sulfite exporter TauE/SafE family protein [Betaproteobacteria bacterium]